MLDGLVMLTYYGFVGGSFGDVLQQWESAGMFSYVLPFLLIFAVVYGILFKTKIFGDPAKTKAINAIISVVVGLMALQFGMVSLFFSELFPRVGVGLSVILVILILVGMFLPKNVDWVKYVLLAVGVIVAIIVISKSLSFVGWTTGGWWTQNWGTILGLVFILLIVGLVVNSGKEGNKPKTYSNYWKVPYFGDDSDQS